MQETYCDTAFLPHVLITMCVVTPVSIWAVTKVHELVTQPGLEKQLSTGWLAIAGIAIGRRTSTICDAMTPVSICAMSSQHEQS